MTGVAEAMGSWGAVGTLMLGLFGLVAPLRAARMGGLAPDGSRGISELRATYGGLFAAMGLACLVLRNLQPMALLPVHGWAQQLLGWCRWRWTEMCPGSMWAASRWKLFWAPFCGQAPGRSGCRRLSRGSTPKGTPAQSWLTAV